MTKSTNKAGKKVSWVKIVLATYWVVVAFFGVTIVTGYGIELSGVHAANENAVADTSGGIGFDTYVCDILIPRAGILIGALTVLMIIAGGVMYATSQGASSGELSVGTAKQMIMAALTGALLWMLGTFLLGSCGIDGGSSGFVKEFLDTNFTP